MNSSIRYGPTPSDLVIGKPPKATYSTWVVQTFIPVRARIGGAWRLGVAREWIRAGGWLVRIETVDENSKAGLCSQWYQFRAESIDRLQIAAASGEVRLAPPQLADRTRGERDQGR